MTIPRFSVVLAIALLLQAGVFAFAYSDLLYLRRPTDAIASDPRATFRANAEAALSRPDLTRRHLEAIADAAQRFGELKYEVRALERRLVLDPADDRIRLRLADALRRSGQLAKAEAIYLQVAMPAQKGAR
jgi:hypothetical protein